jgi:hypothetical protein
MGQLSKLPYASLESFLVLLFASHRLSIGIPYLTVNGSCILERWSCQNGGRFPGNNILKSNDFTCLTPVRSIPMPHRLRLLVNKEFLILPLRSATH